MFDFDTAREIIASGLSTYLNCPVIRSAQNAKPPPYPYVSYSITTLMSENKGTYGVYPDGTDRKPFTQVWSITVLSSDNSECMKLACKSRDWLDHAGTVFLNDNKVVCQSVGSITNRDNFLTADYEYRNGFDVKFWFMNEIINPKETNGIIETVAVTQEEYKNKEVITNGIRCKG